MSQAKRVVLVSRPVGEPKASDFRIEEYVPASPGEGQVLLRTIWLSLDPYMRGRMSDGPSYATPVPVGGVMEGGTVCEVIASNNPGLCQPPQNPPPPPHHPPPTQHPPTPPPG